MTKMPEPSPVPAPLPAKQNVPKYMLEPTEGKTPVYIGGRKSPLAVAQSKIVSELLQQAYPDKCFPVLAITTLGDQAADRALYSFGGKAVWTEELEELLLRGRDGHKLDIVVHSLKDMPTAMPDGCLLGAITKREDPRDALIMPLNSPYKVLKDLPVGSVVGTSSIRRSAQLRRRYPDLKFEVIRGSVATRLAKVDADDSQYACTILAAAGLIRLGLEHRITSLLEAPDMYHAVGQGALGIEIRSNDSATRKLLASVVNHTATSLCCRAERSLMRTLEGGCSVPIGVTSNYDEASSKLTLNGIVISVDGTDLVEHSVAEIAQTEQEADQVGRQLANAMIDMGAKRILDGIRLDSV